MKRRYLYAILLSYLFAVVAIPVVTANECPPSPCDPRSPGYWKNHPDAWPVDEIVIGGLTYPKGDRETPDTALYWMWQPVRGDKTITLFKALVAVILNNAAGYYCDDPPCDCIQEATSLLTRCENGPIGNNWRANTESWQTEGEPAYECLEASYNGD